MTTPTIAPYQSEMRTGQNGFAQLLWSEWTKFRTVRGWVVAIVLAGLVMVGIDLISGGECGMQNGGSLTTGCPEPLGPGGEAVTDSFFFVHQPLASSGGITVQLTSMTGSYSPNGSPGQQAQAPLQPWSKAGILIKANTRQGSAYAAIMVTGSHGVQMQYNYTGDVAGPAGSVSATSPRWLRLTRAGDIITGYASADGTHWSKVGTVTLTGLPSTAQAGLFAASPAYSKPTNQSITGSSANGGPTQATATFDRVTLNGASPGSTWNGTDIGGPNGSYPSQGGAYRPSADGFTVTGSGDVAPAVPGGPTAQGSVTQTLVGTFAGLIAVIIVATMFITTEYRRGLIRLTLIASPRRGHVLAAKAIVIGAVTFVVGLPAALAAILVGQRMMSASGLPAAPVPALTELRLIVGTAALLAVAAVLALAIGAILRRSAAAVTAGIAMIVLTYFFASPLAVLPAGAANWLLRVTPAAGFSIQQAYRAYPQVVASYTPTNGYYPLAPWAGFAVLCAWTALALGLAAYLLRRRDA
jgi:ABC-type transport system involved in multi-copper enzyme maturation permease subunit